jgi:cytochrome bd-type quinol oxidase subunit 2
MTPRPAVRRTSQDAIKTYRYLRIGMIGAVVLLSASVALERGNVDCWQTSVSAYYYTPVRAIFVGTLIAVGFALIVYKGRNTWEDASLNFAGGFAPVVAVAPTTDVGECWSVQPDPLPVGKDGSLAGWVVADIDNNMYALLIVASLGVLVTAAIAAVAMRDKARAPTVLRDLGTRISLALSAAIILLAWWLIGNWDGFYTHAHGYAAVLLFVFLIAAIIVNVVVHWTRDADRSAIWCWTYTIVAALMIIGAAVLPTTRIFGDHTVFALEVYEIALFAAYWVAQTVENWHERIPDEAAPER